jgi:flavodoxin I
LNVLIAYFTQTGNTEKIAAAIHQAVLARGHEADLKSVADITAESLTAYDLVFVGSACHDADLAKPVKRVLEEIDPRPSFQLAGFTTHATHTPEGGERQQVLHQDWAGKCVESFGRLEQEKGIDFLGYFSCQGKPSPPIEAFIHRTIVTNEEEWTAYLAEVRRHPNEDDFRKAAEFAREILVRSEKVAA